MAQPISSVNHLNIDNGLPSNHVYCMLVDEYGYLWISSDKGVTKYNGYNTVLYNFSSGLPYEDIWRLYEDRKRRIWLSSISTSIGYLKNGKFVTAYNPSGNTLYSNDIKDYSDGIFFLSPYVQNRAMSVCYERNDTIFSKELSSTLLHTTSNDRICFVGQMIESIDANSFIKTGKVQNTLITKNTAPTRRFILHCVGDLLIRGEKNASGIYVCNLKNKTEKAIDLPVYRGKREQLKFLLVSDDGYYGKKQPLVVTYNNVYALVADTQLQLLTIISSVSGKPANGDQVSYYMENDMWHKCLSTYDNGIFINPEIPTLFRQSNLKLNNYKSVSTTGDSIAYWWNDNTKILLRCIHNVPVKASSLPNADEIKAVIPFIGNTSLLLCAEQILLKDNRTNITRDLFTQYKPYKKIAINVTELVQLNPDLYYLVCIAGFCKMRLLRNDSLDIKIIHKERFKGMAYDTRRNMVWIYSNYYLAGYIDTTRICEFNKDDLARSGISNVEKILADSSYGNIFLKSHNELFVFTDNFRRKRSLCRNLDLAGAKIRIYKHILIVAGKFGVLFSRINGPGDISNGVYHYNVKNNLYNYVTDMQVSNDQVLLNTDKGSFITDIPDDSLLRSNKPTAPLNYRFLLNYKDSIYNLSAGDTILLNPENISLQFDLVNPNGVGKARYFYKLNGVDTAWNEALGSGIVLAGNGANRYYNVILKWKDEAYQSDEMIYTFFIRPYWWQQPVWQAVFGAGGIIFLSFFGLAMVNITKRMQLKKAEKKGLQLELELKALYAQLNPHFIYNTLNSALLLIGNNKTAEAYTQVSKFSELLRAYVKSSKSKYISIEDEIKNLKNYIDLQQIRFKNKFEYNIIAETGVDTKQVRIPALLLQPLVENAINHGLLNKAGKGLLSIRFSKTASGIVCTIEDDGIGREQAQKLNQNRLSKSYGTELIEDLIRIFRQYENLHIDLVYNDKEPPMTGTIVNVDIQPLKNEP